MVQLMVLDADNPVVEGIPNNNAKGEKTILQPSISSAQRRKLADISNFQDQASKQKQKNVVLSSKEYTQRLQKENMTLMKVLTERNKIIELSGIELQKLRINLQKMQEQNVQLAQANSQMLAELNTNRDRLKALHHELGCQNGLLKARKMQPEGQTIPATHQASQNKVGANVLGGACEFFQADDLDLKNTKRKRQSKIKSSGSSVVKSVHANEKASNKRRVSGRKNETNAGVIDNTGNSEDIISNKEHVLDEANPVKENDHDKRHCVWTQSARFVCHEAEQAENLHVMGNAKVMEDDTRSSMRRQSAGLKSQQPELSENLHQTHEFKERTKTRRASVRRQSMRINFQEPEPNGEVNDGIDAEESTGDAGFAKPCSARREDVVSKSEAVQPSENLNEKRDAKETTRKHRTSTKSRRSKLSNPQVTEAADGIISKDPYLSREKDLKEPNPPQSSDSGKAGNDDKEPKNTPEDGETEGTRRISVGRPSRLASAKIQSYKEVSLKVKMRRPG